MSNRKMSLRVVVLVTVAGLAMPSLADARNRTYRFWVSSGMIELASSVFTFCESSTVNPFPFACPGRALASNGDSLFLTGEGLIKVAGHESVSVAGRQTITEFAAHAAAEGRGSWLHQDGEGTILGHGRWEAVKLVSFQHYGPSDLLPADWHAGRAIMEVRLITNNGSEFAATLVVDCTLPTSAGPIGPGAPGPEGFSVVVNGLEFSTAQMPDGFNPGSSTLFVEVPR